MSTVEKIIEQLKTLTLIESSELVKQIEETFGVDASAPVGGAVIMGSGTESASQEVVEEKTTHPEQLTMMDEERLNQQQMEDARKMARDILEVPAFIRKKQGFDLQN